MEKSSNEKVKQVLVTMSFYVHEDPEVFKQFLRDALVNWGVDGIADYINGEETWTVDGEKVLISEK
jgi:ABC-type taurine transport system substrate-binding protein